MQFASASAPPPTIGERLRESARGALSGAQVWSGVLVVLLTYCFAQSTVTAQWVDGISVIVPLALGAALLSSVLAATRLPWPAGIGITAIAGIVLTAIVVGPKVAAAHPLDPTGLGLIHVWWVRITSGQAQADPSLYLVLIALLMWISGAWLSWCVLRWRKALLGLLPGAAAFATNLLNVPTDQNKFIIFILGLSLTLLLWTTYTGSVARATNAQVKLMGDARWDFWESGAAAAAVVVVLGVLLPPLSTVDKTAQAESSLFTNWAQLVTSLNSHSGIGTGPGISGSSGFSQDVVLGGSLALSREQIFTYTVSGTYLGPHYFRGIDDTLTVEGEWKFPPDIGSRETIHTNQTPTYAEDYSELAVATFNVNMIKPPTGNSDLLFYPGQLDRVSRDSAAIQVSQPDPNSSALYTIDRLGSVQPASGAGSYEVESAYSTATAQQLESAGTLYPDWVMPFASLPASGYRSPEVITRVSALAQQIVNEAHATNPYDEATAIERYLRGPGFTYSLTPPQPPPGVDRLENFLFNTQTGYCQYFATAMGDMLRSLGIPARLVNGFGPGQFETSVNRYVVRGLDAHTWVEAYFPSYGWITFEPTATDGVNSFGLVTRGASGPNLCVHDTACDQTPLTGIGGAVPTPSAGRRGNKEVGPEAGVPSGLGGVFATTDAGTLTKIAGVILALILLVVAAAIRWLRPRTVAGVWRRSMTLARFAGAERQVGDTPLEVGRRLKDSFPESGSAASALARGFAVAAYAPAEVASTSHESVMDAWTELRPILLRRVVARIRRR